MNRQEEEVEVEREKRVKESAPWMTMGESTHTTGHHNVSGRDVRKSQESVQSARLCTTCQQFPQRDRERHIEKEEMSNATLFCGTT